MEPKDISPKFKTSTKLRHSKFVRKVQKTVPFRSLYTEKQKLHAYKTYNKLMDKEKRKIIFFTIKYVFGVMIAGILIWFCMRVALKSVKPSVKGALNDTFHSVPLPFNYETEEEKRASIMNRRRQTLRDGCHDISYNEAPYHYHDDNTKSFFLIEDHNLTWCSVLKAASSSWMYHLHLLKRSVDDLEGKDIGVKTTGRKDYEKPSKEDLEKAKYKIGSISFIVVRHPFERLVSAYRDKMLNPEPKSEYDILRRVIVQEYRAWNSTLKMLHPTFQEFVKYVNDENRVIKGSDPLVLPYSKCCSVCKIDYDIILKQETLKYDLEYFEEVTKSTSFSKLPYTWQNLGRRKTTEFGRTTKDLTKQYFKDLKLSEVTKLYEVYQDDFHLFDYDASEYFSLAKHGRPADDIASLESKSRRR